MAYHAINRMRHYSLPFLFSVLVVLISVIGCHGSGKIHCVGPPEDCTAPESMTIHADDVTTTDKFDYHVVEDEETEEDDFEDEDVICTDDLCTRDDYKEFCDCASVHSVPRPVHNESTWMMMRGAYTAIVGEEDSTIMFPPSYHSGFQVSIIVDQTPDAGRGIFAAERIPKGQRIWTSLTNSARFKTGKTYRQFLNSLPNDLVCDLLMWCYPMFEDEEDDYSVRIACDLDEGSFVNDAEADGLHNFGCDEEAAKAYEGGCLYNFFALREIQAGEEIRAWYGEFASGGEWVTFGL